MKTKTKEVIIDCDAPAQIPQGYNWTIEEHQKGGKLQWNPKNISLYLSEKQKESWVEGNDLRKEIKNPLNANVLDYLLKNPTLIPEDWKGKYVYFWGTIYRYSGGGLYVRYLCWHDGGWDWGNYWLDDGWDCSFPAAVLASPLNLEPQNETLLSDPLTEAIQRVKEAGYKIYKEI
jgi:hypothetical protein